MPLMCMEGITLLRCIAAATSCLLLSGFLGGHAGRTFLAAGAGQYQYGRLSATARSASVPLGATLGSGQEQRESAILVGVGLVAGLASATLGKRTERQRSGTSLRYTTEKILPAMTWLKTGFTSKDIANESIEVVCLAGCDICVGKTTGGKLFAIGDKAPPTGISFSLGSEVQGDTIVEAQYGNAFNVFSGQPVSDTWCPSPPLVGPVIGAVMGGPQAVSVFEARQAFLGNDIEVLVDTNAKKAYEADYWKGLLDAQGKVDGTYY